MNITKPFTQQITSLKKKTLLTLICTLLVPVGTLAEPSNKFVSEASLATNDYSLTAAPARRCPKYPHCKFTGIEI